MEAQVIDGFLPEGNFKFLRNLLLEDLNFPWFYRPTTNNPEDQSYNDWMMTHAFYLNDEPVSDYYPYIKEVSNMFGAISLSRCHAHFTSKKNSDDVPWSDWHRDGEDEVGKGMKIALLYLTETNGCVEFKDGTKVYQKPNRMLLFSNDLEHKMNFHTQGEERRVALNFNYF